MIVFLKLDIFPRGIKISNFFCKLFLENIIIESDVHDALFIS
jgi:hypothetical protein